MGTPVDTEMEEYFETMPFLDRIGVDEVTLQTGTAKMSIPYDEENTNQTTVHGGVMATLVDATVAGAIYSAAEATLTDLEVLTIDLDITYHAPVTAGETVATAEIVDSGRTIAVGRIEIRNKETLVATGKATYFLKWA